MTATIVDEGVLDMGYSVIVGVRAQQIGGIMRRVRASASVTNILRSGKDGRGLTRLVLAVFLLLTTFTFVASTGRAIPAGADSPSAWSIVSSPNRSAIWNNYLGGISCISTTSCTAVGYWQNGGSAGHNESLIEQWDGTEWSIVSNPETGPVGNILYSVSCVSASFCTAVGEQHPGPYQTFVEEWNGTAWSIVPSPDTSATQDNVLYGVSCTSSTSCTAVGYAVNGTVYQTLAEEWDGTAWSIVPSPDPGTGQYDLFYGVSCTSATACTAVGAAEGSTVFQTLVETWDGSSWSIVPSPDTSTSRQNFLEAASCTSASACSAVGLANNGTSYQTLVEEWDGTAWSIVPSPDTSTSQYNALEAISCVAATSCTAVGVSNNGTNYQTLTEAWDGQRVVSRGQPGYEYQRGQPTLGGLLRVALGVHRGRLLNPKRLADPHRNPPQPGFSHAERQLTDSRCHPDRARIGAPSGCRRDGGFDRLGGQRGVGTASFGPASFGRPRGLAPALSTAAFGPASFGPRGRQGAGRRFVVRPAHRLPGGLRRHFVHRLERRVDRNVAGQ